MKNPKISVIMSTYNEKIEFLKASIDSVLHQTFKDFEFLIVLDNPQNSDIKECVESYAEMDPRITIIENENNLGLTKSLNKAIAAANGIYMSRMDADDIMIDKCLERDLQVIENEKLDLVAASKKNIDQHGKILGIYINSFSPKQLKYLLPYDNSINHPTVMVRLDVIRKEGGYRDIASCEDYDLWLRMLRHGSCMKILPDVLLLYRIRPDGICESNSYRLYCSKCFVMNMYRRSKKDLCILGDYNAYNKFMSLKDMTEKKQLKFNQAYKRFYDSILSLKNKKFVLGICQFISSVLMDKEIICVLCKKLHYQVRKKIILRVV